MYFARVAAGGLFTKPTCPPPPRAAKVVLQPVVCRTAGPAGRRSTCRAAPQVRRPCSAAGLQAAPPPARPAVWRPAGPRPTLYHWCRTCSSLTLGRLGTCRSLTLGHVKGPQISNAPDPGPGSCRVPGIPDPEGLCSAVQSATCFNHL